MRVSLLGRFFKPGVRDSKNPELRTINSGSIAELLGYDSIPSSSGVLVNTEAALSVPAIWCAINFLSGTLAGLPLEVYRKSRNSEEKIQSPLAQMLNGAVNDQMSSFEWRKYIFEQVLTTGRSITYIERGKGGQVVNLYPLDPQGVYVEQKSDGRKIYRNKTATYEASEIIDIPYMLKSNQVDARGPLKIHRDTIGNCIAATKYGSKVFQSGGIPLAVFQGPFQSSKSVNSATADIANATNKLAREGKPILALPEGFELKVVGFAPEDMQLLESQRFCVEQIARIYQIPPGFLQDLTNGTFNNTEQQDLHLAKHTIKRWVEQAEAEFNLKIFGRNARNFIKFNMGALLRGDIQSRMGAYSTAIQNGILTPNEARERENLAPLDGGNDLMIQSGTIPIVNMNQEQAPEPVEQEQEENDQGITDEQQ